MTKFHYTPAIIRYIQNHWNVDVSGPDIAAHLGVPYNNLKAAVDRLRKKGYRFEWGTYPVGAEVRHQTQDGGIVVKKKTETGWQYIRSEGRKSKPPKVKKPRKRKQERNYQSVKSETMPRKNTTPTSVKVAPPRNKPAPDREVMIEKSKLSQEWKLANGYQWTYEKRGWQNVLVLKAPEKLAV